MPKGKNAITSEINAHPNTVASLYANSLELDIKALQRLEELKTSKGFRNIRGFKASYSSKR